MAFSSRKLAKVLALAVPCSSFVCSQQVSCVKHHYEYQGIKYCYDDEENCLYLEGTGKEGIIENIDYEKFIATKPEIKSKKPEIKIMSRAFIYTISKNITFVEGITEIGESACTYSGSLTKVNCPSSLREIGKNAFFGCSSLKEVQFQGSLSKIGRCAFGQCVGLTNIKIPEGVTQIPPFAFFGCESLVEVELPNSLRLICRNAFGSCSIEDIWIPENVEKIEAYAFGSCKSLKYAYVSQNTKIEENAFPKTTKVDRY